MAGAQVEFCNKQQHIPEHLLQNPKTEHFLASPFKYDSPDQRNDHVNFSDKFKSSDEPENEVKI